MRLLAVFGLVSGLLAAPLPAQQGPLPPAEGTGPEPSPQAEVPQRSVAPVDPDFRLSMALADERYPVTPGDVYTLTYLAAGRTAAFDTVVQSDYTLNLQLFGRMSVSGRTFAALRREVEGRIAVEHPSSAPALTIRLPGIFSVRIAGAVRAAGTMVAWGLTRLSELVYAAIEDYGTARDVLVRSADGSERRCDVFRGLNLGEESEDPLLRPGDTIVVSTTALSVEVAGEVRRTGVFDLKAGETADLLLKVYCLGFTADADPSRVRLERRGPTGPVVSYHSAAELEGLSLRDGDRLSVPAGSQVLPVVFFEGALLPAPPGGPPGQGSALEAYYGRLTLSFVPGETLFNSLPRVQPLLSPLADLAKATIIRQGEPAPITVNLQQAASQYIPEQDNLLRPHDRIVIPAIRHLVTVSGAVVDPGSYVYEPGRTAGYYLALAGGVDPERNRNGRLVVRDSQGVSRSLESPVAPGSRILVPASRFSYNLTRYYPILATTLTLVTATITLLNSLAR